MTNGEVIETLFPNVGTNFSNILDLNLWWNAKYKTISEIHCNCTDEEIAKSFIEDIKAVEDLLPQREIEQQPSEDCISREAVDNYIVKLMSGYLYDEERTRLEDLTTYIWKLPSVTPTRPKGKWSRPSVVAMPYSFAYECPICRQWGNIQTFEPNYCPNCGAKMEVNTDEN